MCPTTRCRGRNPKVRREGGREGGRNSGRKGTIHILMFTHPSLPPSPPPSLLSEAEAAADDMAELEEDLTTASMFTPPSLPPSLPPSEDEAAADDMAELEEDLATASMRADEESDEEGGEGGAGAAAGAAAKKARSLRSMDSMGGAHKGILTVEGLSLLGYSSRVGRKGGREGSNDWFDDRSVGI